MAKFFPVVHLLNEKHGMAETAKAFDAGADGVFLINHDVDAGMAVQVAEQTKNAYPDWYVGINLLGSSAAQAFEHAIGSALDAIWADSVGVHNGERSALTEELRKLHVVHPFVDIYGGVAFKYQRVDPNPTLSVYQLSDLGWVPCTSGAGTGQAANVATVETLANASSTGLALASGVTLENVDDYLGHVSHFFVASSIALDEHTLDFERMRALAGKIHRVRS